MQEEIAPFHRVHPPGIGDRGERSERADEERAGQASPAGHGSGRIAAGDAPAAGKTRRPPAGVPEEGPVCQAAARLAPIPAGSLRSAPTDRPAVAPCDCQTPVAVPASLAEVGRARSASRQRPVRVLRRDFRAPPPRQGGGAEVGRRLSRCESGTGAHRTRRGGARRISQSRRAAPHPPGAKDRARARVSCICRSCCGRCRELGKTRSSPRNECLGSVTSAEILVLDQLGADMGARWAEEKEDKLLYILTRCFQNGGLLRCAPPSIPSGLPGTRRRSPSGSPRGRYRCSGRRAGPSRFPATTTAILSCGTGPAV